MKNPVASGTAGAGPGIHRKRKKTAPWMKRESAFFVKN